MLERRSTPFARQPVPQPFLHACPWRSPTALLSAPPVVASTRTTLALRASCIPVATHLARTLGFPGCPLSISAHAVLMGALLRLTYAHFSGDSRVHLVATDVRHFITSCLGAHQFRIKPAAFVVIPMPSFPQAEQFLLIEMHEFPHFILTRELVPFFCRFFVNNPAYPLRIFRFLLLFPQFQLLLILSQLLPLLEQLGVPTFLFVPISRLCCSRRPERVDACLCIYFASSFQLVLSAGDRPYTCFDKSWPSFIACGQSKHAQIRHCRSRSGHGHDLRHALHSRVGF